GVVADVGAVEREVETEPGERSGIGPDLVGARHHGAERRVRGDARLEARAHRPRPGAGQFQERGGAEAFPVAHEEAEPLAEVQVEAGPWVETVARERAAARTPQPVVDRVTEVVPSRGRREDEAGSRTGEIPGERDGVLRIDPDGVLPVQEVSDDLLPVLLLER